MMRACFVLPPYCEKHDLCVSNEAGFVQNEQLQVSDLLSLSIGYNSLRGFCCMVCLALGNIGSMNNKSYCLNKGP